MSYFSLGNVADHAASLGYKVTGTIEGATVGRQAYVFGPITSVFMTKLLVDKLKIDGSSPIPVGFNGADAPMLNGYIAEQFPDKHNSELSGSDADREVVEAYLSMERPQAEEGYEVPVYDVPVVSYTDIIETRRIGRTRTDVLRVGEFPEKFYLRVAGSQDDLETMGAICQEDGIAFVMEDEVCYITNIDLLGFPPLPEHLYDVHLEKDVPLKGNDGSQPGGPMSQGPMPRAPAGPGAGAPPPSAQTRDGGELPLPQEWTGFMVHQTIDAYIFCIASVGFARAVTSNKRQIGSNKHGWTKRVLNHWEVGSLKTVPDYIELLMSTASRNEAMAAKLMRALSTHLRVEGDYLKRTALQEQ